MLIADIDILSPCLIDTKTGDIVETEALRITRKSFLSKFNKKTGWYENWATLSDNNEIYALVIKGTVAIQGLIAIQKDTEKNCLFLSWAVSAPHNNKLNVSEKRYTGVGAHLFAIAASKAFEYGFSGEMTGFAANKILVEHYKSLGAIHMPTLHENQVIFLEDASRKLIEVYTYEWSNDKL